MCGVRAPLTLPKNTRGRKLQLLDSGFQLFSSGWRLEVEIFPTRVSELLHGSGNAALVRFHSSGVVVGSSVTLDGFRGLGGLAGHWTSPTFRPTTETCIRSAGHDCSHHGVKVLEVQEKDQWRWRIWQEACTPDSTQWWFKTKLIKKYFGAWMKSENIFNQKLNNRKFYFSTFQCLSSSETVNKGALSLRRYYSKTDQTQADLCLNK